MPPAVFMFNKIKSFFTKSSDQLFSSMAILPFSKFKKNWSQKEFLNAYEISLYANKALNKRAEKVGEIDFLVKRGEDAVENHPILDLLAKPNKVFSGAEFWGLYQKYYDIFGEVYILTDTEMIMGGRTKVNELHLLRPDLVKPFFDKQTGEVTKVEYKTAEGTQTIEGERIIYSHNPDPANPLRGESLLRAGIRQIELATNIDEYHSKVLENGGRVEGVFNFKSETLGKQQLRELKDSYQEEYGKAAQAGLPMFLGGNATYQRLGLNPAELAYLDTKKVNLNDIVFLTGVPQAILGQTSGETFANADASIRIFLRETIKPLLNALSTKINETLLTEEGLELGFVDPTPENKEEKRKDLETANTINAMTVNEKREALELEAIPDGDVIMMPLNLVPFGKDKEEPPREEVKKKRYHPLDNLDNRRIYHALQLKRLDRRTEKMLDVVRDFFQGQKERITSQLEQRKQFKVKGLMDEIFNLSMEIGLAKEAALPLLKQLLEEAGMDSKEISGSDFDFNTTADIESWLDSKSEFFAKSINNTTFNKLKKQFQQSLDAGETRVQLIDRITDTYDGISDDWAEVIARTEVHGATMKGTLEGYKQAGLPDKVWVWAPGVLGGVRDNHQAMDGERVDLKANFSNGLEAPGIGGSAAEVVNCMCFI